MKPVSGHPESETATERPAASGCPVDDLPRLVDSVRRYCRSRTASEVDAEDAAQAAFVRFFERPRDVENLEAWLIQAASFECRDVHRRRARDTGVAAEPEVAPRTTGPALDPQRVVTEKLLIEDLMSRLPPRDRELLTLRYLADFSVDQLARRLRVSQGNARIMALRARRRAHDALRMLEGGAAAIGLLGLLRLARRGKNAAVRAGAGTAARVENSLGSVLQAGFMQLSGLDQALVPAVVAAFLGGGVLANTAGAAASLPPATAASASVADAVGGQPVARPLPSADDSSARQGGAVVGAVGPSAVPLAQDVLAPGAGATQRDVGFTSVTASPDYQSDHTAFAAGTLVNQCAGTCTVIFVTHDAGHTWSLLTVGTTYQGGAVVLPNDYPSDPAILVTGPMGLTRSDDGGKTFHPAVPEPSTVPAAADPSAPRGDPQIVLGGSALTVYHVATRTLSAGPALPAGVDRADQVAFAAPGRMVVTGVRVDPLAPSQQDGVVVTCDPTCSVVASFPGVIGWQVATSPGGSSPAGLAVYAGNQVAVSPDGGLSFAAPVAMPQQAQTATVLPGSAGAPSLLVAPASRRGQASPPLIRSDDGGHSFATVTEVGLPTGVVIGDVLALPDGHLMVAFATPGPAGQFGLRCSPDRGATWTPSC